MGFNSTIPSVFVLINEPAQKHHCLSSPPLNPATQQWSNLYALYVLGARLAQLEIQVRLGKDDLEKLKTRVTGLREAGCNKST